MQQYLLFPTMYAGACMCKTVLLIYLENTVCLPVSLNPFQSSLNNLMCKMTVPLTILRCVSSVLRQNVESRNVYVTKRGITKRNSF